MVDLNQIFPIICPMAGKSCTLYQNSIVILKNSLRLKLVIQHITGLPLLGSRKYLPIIRCSERTSSRIRGRTNDLYLPLRQNSNEFCCGVSELKVFCILKYLPLSIKGSSNTTLHSFSFKHFSASNNGVLLYSLVDEVRCKKTLYYTNLCFFSVQKSTCPNFKN